MKRGEELSYLRPRREEHCWFPIVVHRCYVRIPLGNRFRSLCNNGSVNLLQTLNNIKLHWSRFCTPNRQLGFNVRCQ